QSRIYMAAVVDFLQEMNAILVAQNRLQPSSPHFVTRRADEVDQILPQTQDICGIEGWLMVPRRRLRPIDSLEERVQKHRLRGAVPPCARLHVFNQQRAIAESFLSATADDIGRFNYLIADDHHDVARAIVVVPLRLPMYRGKTGVVRPRLRASHGNSRVLQGLHEVFEILLRLLNDLGGESSARN